MSLLKKILGKLGVHKNVKEIIEKSSFDIKPGDINYEFEQLALLHESSVEREIIKACLLYSKYSELKLQGYDVWIEGKRRDNSGTLYTHKIFFD